MPLIAFMKTTDPGRISSITSSGDKLRRKKIIPIPVDISGLYTELYVIDCIWHRSPGKDRGVVVPVELRVNRNNEWVSLGDARCCPLCWTIIEPPEGVELPPPQRAVVEDKVDRYDGMQRRLNKTKKGRGTEIEAARKFNEVRTLLQQERSVTVKEVMLLLDLSRTAAKYYLEKAVKRGVATSIVQGLGGPNNQTLYHWKLL